MSVEKILEQQLAQDFGAVLDVESRAHQPGRVDDALLLDELRAQQRELETQNRDLRAAHDALEESRTRYADLYDFSPIAYYTFDEQGYIRDVNLTGAKLVGRAREQLIGVPFLTVMGMQDASPFWAHLRQCATTGMPVVAELSFKTLQQGVQQDLEVQAVSAPVLDANESGRTITFRTAFTDISASKRAQAEEQKARESEHRLRAQLEAVDQAVMAVSKALAEAPGPSDSPVLQVIADQARQLAQAAAATLTLSSDAGVLSARVISGLLPAPSARSALASQAPASGSASVSIRYAERVLGTLVLYAWPDSSALAEHEQQGVQRFAERVGFAMEIARLKVAEARERERLRLLAETTRQLTGALSLEAMRTAVARNARLTLPLLGDYCIVYLAEDQELWLAEAAHVNRDEEQRLKQLQPESRMRCDSELFVCLLSTRQSVFLPVYDPAREADVLREEPELARVVSALDTKSIMVVPLVAHHQLIGITVFGSHTPGRRFDAGDLSLAEEIAFRSALAIDRAQLYQRAQTAIQLRENLLAIVSHDLKSPLNAISLSARMMARPNPLGERRRARRQVDTISRSAERMGRLIDHLLTATTIEAGRFTIECQDNRVSDLVEEAFQMAEPLVGTKELRLERRVPGQLPQVFCDRERILQVFSNLIGNAIKFSPEGGSIVIEARQGESEVCFSVTDEGPGISAEQLPHLFDRYWKGGSHEGQGVGLGLFIAKSIVDAHGAKLWVQSMAGRGSTFFFTLPVTKSSRARPAIPRTLLVVDDDRECLDAIRDALESEGYGVEAAYNGAEAMRYLERSAPPSLILLDLNMPVMDGFAFAQQQREQPKVAHVPVIVLSAERHIAQAAEWLGSAGYLRKPVDLDNLLAVVKHHCPLS